MPHVSVETSVRAGVLALACVAAVATGAAVRTQEKPLPDRTAFLDDALKRLRNDLNQGPYTCRERQLREDYDGDGHVEKRVTKEFEVYPTVEGSPAYRRLVAVNGVPEPAPRLAEADRKQREKLQEWLRDRRSESASARAKRERKEKQQLDLASRVVDDIPRVYDIRLVGREEIGGRPAILLTVTPRPGVRPVEDDAVPLTKLAGRAWVDEQDYAVVRAKFESTDSINVGLGLIARIDRGTTVALERQKVPDGAWLPTRFEVHPRARIALVKRLDAHFVTDYTDYRKFTVEDAIALAAHLSH